MYEATILEIIHSISPILCRPGGKKLLKNRIIKEMPPHKTYVEPFLGTGAVFFAKSLSDKNILGDNDRALMDFYKKVQKQDKLTCDIRRNHSRWKRLKNKQNKTACDYAYVQKASLNCRGEKFNQPHIKGGTNSIQNYDRQVQKLSKAKLIHGDFKRAIGKYDSKDTLFYLDPPYHETDCSYPEGSCNVKPQDVKNAVKNIRGKFILSYNNHPDVRETFCKDYNCKTVKTRYTSSRTKKTNRDRRELIIKNF